MPTAELVEAEDEVAVADGAVVAVVGAAVEVPEVCATTGEAVAAATVEEDESSDDDGSFDASADAECA